MAVDTAYITFDSSAVSLSPLSIWDKAFSQSPSPFVKEYHTTVFSEGGTFLPLPYQSALFKSNGPVMSVTAEDKNRDVIAPVR